MNNMEKNIITNCVAEIKDNMLATRIRSNLSFGAAFDLIKNKDHNYYMRLPSWKSEVNIKVQYPDDNSKMTHPYLYVESRYGRVPWKETMVELFSEEWQVYEYTKIPTVSVNNKTDIKPDKIKPCDCSCGKCSDKCNSESEIDDKTMEALKSIIDFFDIF